MVAEGGHAYPNTRQATGVWQSALLYALILKKQASQEELVDVVAELFEISPSFYAEDVVYKKLRELEEGGCVKLTGKTVELVDAGDTETSELRIELSATIPTAKLWDLLSKIRSAASWGRSTGTASISLRRFNLR